MPQKTPPTVTILIPTASRPAMLQKALQSVADQTALGRITRVYVSENGQNPASNEVCRRFPNLPISYIYREPACTPLEHAQILMRECLEGDFTCILHDDDWWLPDHIHEAIRALESHPDASAYGANYISCIDDVLRVDRTHSLLPWFAANYPVDNGPWILSKSNILLGSLVNFVIHYSTMVIRTECLKRAAYVYDMNNAYDNDRMIIYALSQFGPVLFNPKNTACVRHHSERETTRFSMELRNRCMCETTRWMVASSLKSWAAISKAFVKRLAACIEGEIKADLLKQAFTRECCLIEMSRHLDDRKDTEFFAMFGRARGLFSQYPQTPNTVRC